MATEVNINDLSTWLSNQPDNTTSTPYEITITGITTSNYNDLWQVLYDNSTKYVDLYTTQLPDQITSLGEWLHDLSNIIRPPEKLPSGVTEIGKCFSDCSNLIYAPIVPDAVTYAVDAFKGTAITHKPIIPSGATQTDCFKNVSTKNWKGTESQIASYKTTLESLTSTDTFEVQVYDTDRVTLLDSVYWVNFNNLNTWLGNQPTNTASTPYRLNIIGLTSSNTSDLGDELSTFPIKYVDLRVTVLPQDLTTLSSVFYALSGLVYAPIVPANVTTMIGAFRDCSALKEMPIFDSGSSISDLTTAFYNCTSLQSVSSLPSGILNMNATFRGCTSLRQVPLFPDTVTDVSVCYYGCTLLTVKPIIPSTVTTSTSCYDNVTTPNWKGTQSQAESFLSTFFAQTADSELQIYNNDRVTYDHSIYNIDISNLSTAYDFVSGLAQNTPETAYKIYLRGLTSSNAENITRVFGYIYIQTPTKYYNFGYTTIPQGTSLTNLFWRTDGYYMYSCSSMVTAPVLPTDQTSMNRTFSYCFALKNVTIPNGITSLEQTFSDCSSLETIVIPNTVTTMTYTFSNCVSLVDAPEIPSGVTNIRGAFQGCTSLTTAPEIPSSVTDISGAFYNCTSIENVSSISSSVTNGEEAFSGCTSLRKIDEFHIPLATLKNNTNFQDMFAGCTSLTQIGFKVDASKSWHVFSLTIGQSTVEGTVYGVNTNKQITTATISSTSITKSSIRLPVLTDELWFPAGMTASEIEDTIEDMLNYKYGVFNKQVIPPNDKQMVIWADEDENHNAKVVTNIASGIEVETISASKTITPTKDKRVIVDTASITVTLSYGVTNGITTEVFAMQACTVTYYTAQGTTASLSMASGSKAVFIYYSGWKLHSNYGTTNQVTVDNMQSVSSNAVAQALTSSKVKFMPVFKQYNAPINTDKNITDVPTTSDLPAGSEIIVYLPVSVRPLQSWAQCPVQLYVNSAHNMWIIRSLGTYSGDFEVEWAVFYI